MPLRNLLALAALMVLLCCQRSYANGLVREGVGAISVGRGGTNLGFADNGAIILDNPAAMSNVDGCGLLDLGVDTFIGDLKYTDGDPNADFADVSGYPSGMLGYVHHMPYSDFTWGIGVFAPAGFGAQYDLNNPVLGPSIYKSLGVLGKVLPAVSYRLTDQLSIGGSIGVAISHAELEGPFFPQTGALAGAPTLMDLQMTGAAPTGSVGLQYQMTPSTTIGLAYTEETRFVFDGSAVTQTMSPFGLLYSEFDAQLDLVWPRSLGIGLQHQLCDCQRLGFDVIWYDWSHAFDRLDMRLTNPSNPMIIGLVGPVITDSFPLRWKDTVSFRFGYEWDSSAVCTWRFGYVYNDSPAPDATLTPYLDGVLEHSFSLGYTRRLYSADLNLAYQYQFGPERQVGDSEIVGNDFDNSTFRAQAHWIAVSVSVPF